MPRRSSHASKLPAMPPCQARTDLSRSHHSSSRAVVKVPKITSEWPLRYFVAEEMARHPRVAQVLYPGLPDFPGHATAAHQMTGGFGGMLSIRVRGGKAAAIATAAGVSLWKRATSLGGVESLIEHRASIEGPASPVPLDLLRLSVGIEEPADLIADLETALAA